MHRFFSKFQKITAPSSGYFLSNSELLEHVLRTKYLQNNFLLLYLLGLSTLSTSACDGKSEDPTFPSKMTEREMNLANIKKFNTLKGSVQETLQDESLKIDTLASSIFVTVPENQKTNITQEELTTTVTTVEQHETKVSQTIPINVPDPKDEDTPIIHDGINANDIASVYAVSAGNVVKGPLNHALVFLDIDGDGNPVDEPFVYTKVDGSYDLLEAFRNHQGVISKERMENATLTVLTYENTIDTISDNPLPDIILKAPFGSSVLSPLTTIMSQAELTSIELANLLEITQQDFYNFNPFSASSDLEFALEVEIIGLQFASILTALSGATKGVLADGLRVVNPNATKADEKWITIDNMNSNLRAQSLESLWQELSANLGASEIVLNEIVRIVKNKSESGETLNLLSLNDINLITEALDLALVTRLNETEGASAQNTLNAMGSFRARSDIISEELVGLNTKISTITDLYSKETVETVSLISGLSKKVFNQEVGTWIDKDQISFSGVIEDATDKTGAMKLKGSLDAFSLEAQSNPLDVKAVHEENGRFVLTWTNNDTQTGHSIQLKTIDDPNGSKKFKATKDQTDFIFDYSFMENSASVKTIMANEGQSTFEFPTEVSKDQIIITRSSDPKRPLETDEFTFADGIITLTNNTEANEKIRISESIPAIMVLRSYKDATVDPILDENFVATDGQSIILAEPCIWGEIIKIYSSSAPNEKEVFIADAGQTKFDFSYKVDENIHVFRSKVAKFSPIASDEYSSNNGIVTLLSPAEQNELVEIRKLPANNKVIDLFSSTNFRTSNPEIMRLNDNELIIVSTATNKQSEHSAILVQIQKQDNQKKGIEYSNTESIHLISENTKVPDFHTTTSSRYTDPVITLADNNNFIVGWTNNTKSLEGKNVELQVFDENGPVMDKRFTLNDYSIFDQYSLDLVNLPAENKIAATWVEVEKGTASTDIIYSHFDISKPSGVNLSGNSISLSISVFGQQVPIKIKLKETDFVDGNLVMSREAFELEPDDFINKISVQYDPFGQFDRLNFDRTSISEISGARDNLIQAFSKGVNLGEALNVNYNKILGLSVNGPLLSEQSTKITLSLSGSELPINLLLTDANFTNGRLILTAEELNNQISLGENEEIVSIVAQTDPTGNFDTQNAQGTFTEDPISRIADNIGTWTVGTEETAGNLSLNFDPYLGIMVTGIGDLERLNHKNIIKDELTGIKISENKPEDLNVFYKFIEPASRVFLAKEDQTQFAFQSEASSDQLIINRSYGDGMPLLPEDYSYLEGIITLKDKAKQNESIKITTPSSSTMLSINTSTLPYTPNKDNIQVSVEHTGLNGKVLLELEAENFLLANDVRIGENGFVENDLTFSGIQLDKQLDLKPGDEITSIVVQSDPTANFDKMDINSTFLWDQDTKYFDKLGKWTALNQQELDEFDINFNPTLILPNDGNPSVVWTAWNPQKQIYQLIYRKFDDDGNLSRIITLEDKFSLNPSDFDIATKGNEIFVTWNKTNEMGSSIVMSSFSPASDEESVQDQFENNFVTIKNNVDATKSMPKITFDSENELFVTWVASPTLTKDHLTDFELVFDLIDLEALNVQLASYAIPENETIDNMKELIPYLLDQNINFLEKDLENQIAMLDDKKVQNYLDNETDMIFYTELSDIYSNLASSDIAVIA